MRSIWAGAISFGLVVIPVKLYAATEQRDITFRQVHRKDGARIQFRHFAPSAQVEPILAAKSYYTEPEPTGARAYVLFRDALERSGKVAVVKVALRQRETLAALRVREGVITLETLLWPDEVRKPDFAFLDEDIEVRSQELKMAASLIETMTEDFDPDQYHDTYREALESVVQAKVEGNDVVRPAGVEAPEPRKQPADLAEILRASVAALKDQPGQSRDRRRKAASPRQARRPRQARQVRRRLRRRSGQARQDHRPGPQGQRMTA